ncbi:MAG: hypothetical protein ABI972_31825 [Acidobacteriota bacterium]
MRFVSIFFLCVLVLPAEMPKAKKPGKVPAAPLQGVKTPGVQIPFSRLKSEADLDLGGTPGRGLFAESLWVPVRSKDMLAKVDPKAAKLGDSLTGLNKPCAGAVEAFGSLWVPNCGNGTIARIDTKTGKVSATLETGAGDVNTGIAATADSMWVFTDARTTLARIDPKTNLVVSELRLPEKCDALLSAESSLWCACTAQGKVLRIDPKTNLVAKRIETQPQPAALASGDGSIWAYCKKDGKLDRIDPKTDKVTKSIELGVAGAEGDVTFGEGSVWVSQAGFPVSRIDTKSEKVLQQFWGPGGGIIRASAGSLWLFNVEQNSVSKLDPKRVQATLAE